jgi:hypothetical protein
MLGNPAFTQLPSQIGQFSDLLGEVSHRLSPLTQLAESAGGLFAGFRVPGSRPATPSAAPIVDTSRTIVTETKTVHTAPPPATTRAPAKKTATKKSAAKKKAAAKKRAPAKKRTATKRPATSS